MRIVLIRHGETIDNVNGVISDSFSGPSLTSTGILATMEKIATIKSYIDVNNSLILSSPATRALETASLIAVDSKIIVCNELSEVSIGVPGTDNDVMISYLRSLHSDWNLGLRLDEAPVGGETGLQVLQRLTSFWHQLLSFPEVDAFLVSHFLTIRMLMQILNNPIQEPDFPFNSSALLLYFDKQRSSIVDLVRFD
jgi:phosphoglycerate mutase family protein